MQKTARKETKYSRNETIFKIGHHAKAMENPYFGSKIKIPKNMSNSILQVIYRWSVQKTARKKTKNARNETISKMDHQGKAIALAKSSLGVKNKIPKNMSKFILQIIYSCSLQKNTRKKTQMVEKGDHF